MWQGSEGLFVKYTFSLFQQRPIVSEALLGVLLRDEAKRGRSKGRTTITVRVLGSREGSNLWENLKAGEPNPVFKAAGCFLREGMRATTLFYRRIMKEMKVMKCSLQSNFESSNLSWYDGRNEKTDCFSSLLETSCLLLMERYWKDITCAQQARWGGGFIDQSNCEWELMNVLSYYSNHNLERWLPHS